MIMAEACDPQVEQEDNLKMEDQIYKFNQRCHHPELFDSDGLWLGNAFEDDSGPSRGQAVEAVLFRPTLWNSAGPIIGVGAKGDQPLLTVLVNTDERQCQEVLEHQYYNLLGQLQAVQQNAAKHHKEQHKASGAGSSSLIGRVLIDKAEKFRDGVGGHVQQLRETGQKCVAWLGNMQDYLHLTEAAEESWVQIARTYSGRKAAALYCASEAQHEASGGVVDMKLFNTSMRFIFVPRAQVADTLSEAYGANFLGSMPSFSAAQKCGIGFVRAARSWPPISTG
jgi:hypothetical protein